MQRGVAPGGHSNAQGRSQARSNKCAKGEYVMAIARLAAIKRYFELDGGRPIKTEEIKALTPDDREELAQLAAIELKEELQATTVPKVG